MHSGGVFMIELHQLKQLITISEEQTLSKAAQRLYISQPALTRSIQKLESELGVTLFDRTKNKAILNENGKEAVKYAKKIINDTCKMKTHLIEFDKNNKTFHIGTIAPAPLWPIEYILKNHYPNSILQNEMVDEDTLIKGLNNNHYSLIILNHPIESNDDINIKIFDEHLYLSVPPTHEFASLKEISFQQLDGTSVLLRSKLGYWRTLKERVIPHSNLLFQDDDIIMNELIKHSSLPSFRTNISLLRLKEDENRIYIPFSNKEAKVTFYAIYKKENEKYFSLLKDEINKVDISQI